MATATQEGLALQVSDVTGQRTAQLAGVPTETTVSELVQGLLAHMNLPQNDVEGRPLAYHVRLEREGRHLHGSEVVGDALQTDDHLVLQPNIMAG